MLPNWDVTLQDAAAPYIVKWADAYDIPLEIAFAIVAQESSFKPRAYRYEAHINDASYGLAQILTRTAKGIGYTGTPEGLFDPDVNLQWGLKYLRQMYDRFNAWDVAISSYNEGPASARIGNPKYVRSVQDRANYFARSWGNFEPVFPIPLPLPGEDPGAIGGEGSFNDYLPWLVGGTAALLLLAAVSSPKPLRS